MSARPSSTELPISLTLSAYITAHRTLVESPRLATVNLCAQLAGSAHT